MKENIRAALRPGFTLIELLVVVLIIGVLAAIALPMYQKAVEKSRAAEMIAFVGNAKRAVEAYLLQNGGQPSSPVELINGDLTGTDLRQGMNCSIVSEDDGEQCLSKHYSYRVECDNGGCFIEIRRIENQDRDQVHMVGWVEMQPGVDWYTRAAYLDKIGQVSCEELAKHFAGAGRCMGPEAFGGGDDNGGDDNGGDDEENSWSQEAASDYMASTASSLLQAILDYWRENPQAGGMDINTLIQAGLLDSNVFSEGEDEEEHTAQSLTDGGRTWRKEGEGQVIDFRIETCHSHECQIRLVWDSGEGPLLGGNITMYFDPNSDPNALPGTSISLMATGGDLDTHGNEEMMALCQSIVSSLPAGMYDSSVTCH